MFSAEVELRLFGSPTLNLKGHEVQLHSRKALALLAYLALEAGRDHPRSDLAQLLWNGSESPRHNLRQALYSLRSSLGPAAEACLTSDRQTARFDSDDRVFVDALAFRAAGDSQKLDLDQLAHAAALYVGPFMLGMDPSDQPEFESWLLDNRRQFEGRHLQIIARLAEGHLRLHQLEEAQRWARRLLAEDPLQENAHRLLMRVQAANGDQSALEAQYQQCVDLLRDELGSDVSPHTSSLYRQLSRGASQLHVASTVPEDPPVDSEWLTNLPMVGRGPTLQRLDDLLAKAHQGQTQLAWVEGESGMGKTRLLNEFLRTTLTLDEPVRTLYASCQEHEFAAPYTLWADALRPLRSPRWESLWRRLPQVWQDEISRLIPEYGDLSTPLSGLTPAEGRLRLHQAVVRTLSQLTERTTLILALDDLHWIDEASLALLSYVARNVDRARLLMIGAHRPEIASENMPWARFLSDPNHLGVRLHLGQLTAEQVRNLLEQLPAAYDEGLPELLRTHSDGNPLVLLETLRGLRDAGHVVPRDNRFQIAPPGDQFPLPNAVQDLVRQRLTGLSDDARRALQGAAVIGRPFSPRLLTKVTGLSEPFLLDICSDLERRGLFKSEPRDRHDRPLNFAHNYIQRALYEDLGPSTRQTLHMRVAEALSQQDPLPRSDLEEVAFHFERARDRRALEPLLQTGRQALDLYAFVHTVRVCQRGLALAEEVFEENEEVRYELLTLLETALDRMGRRQEQLAVIEQLLDLTAQQQDRRRNAQALLRRASLLTYLGRHRQARSAGEEAVRILSRLGDRSGQAQALRELAFDHWGARDFTTALDYAREVLEIHRSLNQVGGEASALHNLAEIHRELGSPRRALDLYRQSIELHWSSQDAEGEGLAYYGMGHAQRQLDEIGAAVDSYQNALRALRRAGDRLMTSRVYHTLAALYQQKDQLDLAHEEAQRALKISRQIGYGPGIAHGLTALSQLYIAQGKPQLAAESLTEAIDWLSLLEDDQAASRAESLLDSLEKSGGAADLPWPEPGWVRSHVPLEGGKVYCAFESPLARAGTS